MKEIVVISGKGGTGKTSITASLAYLAGRTAVIADCDVDASDMHLLMQPDIKETHDFYSSLLAEINQDACISCGKCADVCRWDAVPIIDNQYVVSDMDCEGCGYCAVICPTKAIDMKQRRDGEWYISKAKTGSAFIHAKLDAGSENSGKLVAQVKNAAKEIALEFNKDYVIVDGSPGVGCPVVSSLSGAYFVLLITEPTVSGLHDLKRVYELVKKFHLKAGCIINKADLNPDKTQEIKQFLQTENVKHIADIFYNEAFTKAMTYGKTIVEYDDNLKTKIIDIWNKIKEI